MTDGVTDLIARIQHTNNLQRTFPPEERKRIRQEAHVSFRELSTVIGVSYMALSAWERGGRPKANASLDAYNRYLELLQQIDQVLKETA